MRWDIQIILIWSITKIIFLVILTNKTSKSVEKWAVFINMKCKGDDRPCLTSHLTPHIPEMRSSLTNKHVKSSSALISSISRYATWRTAYQLDRKEWIVFPFVSLTGTNHLTCGVGYPSTVQNSFTRLFSNTVCDLSLVRNLGPLIIDDSRMYFSGIFLCTCQNGKKKDHFIIWSWCGDIYSIHTFISSLRL